MGTVQTIEVSQDDDGIRLDRWFKRHYPHVTFGQLQKLLRSGQVRVDGGRVKQSGMRLQSGQSVRVPPIDEAQAPPAGGSSRRSDKPAVSDADAQALRDAVLYMDDYVIAINKPAGLAVQGGTATHRHLDGMLDALRFDAKERPKLVHRLDKDTSGVLILARSAKAAQVLSEAFHDREARKLYWAIVVGVPKPPTGRIDAAIAKQPGRTGERMEVDFDNGKRAVTEYRVVEKAGRKAAWVELSPLTGRTHQLRVHMAALGTPIVGDGKYGAKEAFLDAGGISKKLHLHARAIRLPLKGLGAGKVLDVVAPLPEHMKNTWEFLEFDEAQAGTPFDGEDSL